MGDYEQWQKLGTAIMTMLMLLWFEKPIGHGREISFLMVRFQKISIVSYQSYIAIEVLKERHHM